MEKIKVTKTHMLIYIAIFSCFKIDILSYFSKAFTLGYLLLQMFCVLVLGSEILSKKGIKKIDVFTALYCMIGFIATALNHLSLTVWIQEMVRFLAMIYTVRYCIEYDAKIYIKGVATYLGTLTIINTVITLIVHPQPLRYDGPNPIFFLGGDNTSVRLYILAAMFSVLAVNIKKHGRVFAFLVWASFAIFTFVRDLGTGKICLFVITLGIIVFLKTNAIMPKKIIGLIGIANAAFFVLLMSGGYKIFRYVIVTLLHRDISLTTRTTIWQITIGEIINKPILGNGYVTGKQFESMLPHIIGVNAHNTLLMIVYMGGAILLIAFVCIYLTSEKIYDKNYHKPLCSIIPIAFLAMTLRAQVEGGDAAYLIYFFHLFFLISKVEAAVGDRKGKRILVCWKG